MQMRLTVEFSYVFFSPLLASFILWWMACFRLLKKIRSLPSLLIFSDLEAIYSISFKDSYYIKSNFLSIANRKKKCQLFFYSMISWKNSCGFVLFCAFIVFIISFLLFVETGFSSLLCLPGAHYRAQDGLRLPTVLVPSFPWCLHLVFLPYKVY